MAGHNLPCASITVRWAVAHGQARVHSGITPALPQHHLVPHQCGPRITYPLEEVLGSVLRMPVLEGFRS